MTAPRILSLEELTERFGTLQEAFLEMRYELGESCDGNSSRPIHTRLENLEAFSRIPIEQRPTPYKRQT